MSQLCVFAPRECSLMAVASVGAPASLWGFCRSSQNSAADFSPHQSKSVLWSWNFFNPWRSEVTLGGERSKVAVGGKICNLDVGAVVANAWRAWVRESLPLHIFLISASSVNGLFYSSFWIVVSSILSLAGLPGSKKVQAVSELTLISWTFSFFKVSICGSVQCKWVVFKCRLRSINPPLLCRFKSLN